MLFWLTVRPVFTALVGVEDSTRFNTEVVDCAAVEDIVFDRDVGGAGIDPDAGVARTFVDREAVDGRAIGGIREHNVAVDHGLRTAAAGTPGGIDTALRTDQGDLFVDGQVFIVGPGGNQNCIAVFRRVDGILDSVDSVLANRDVGGDLDAHLGLTDDLARFRVPDRQNEVVAAGRRRIVAVEVPADVLGILQPVGPASGILVVVLFG